MGSKKRLDGCWESRQWGDEIHLQNNTLKLMKRADMSVCQLGWYRGAPSSLNERSFLYFS
jgi:hypothetical protein